MSGEVAEVGSGGLDGNTSGRPTKKNTDTTARTTTTTMAPIRSLNFNVPRLELFAIVGLQLIPENRSILHDGSPYAVRYGFLANRVSKFLLIGCVR